MSYVAVGLSILHYQKNFQELASFITLLMLSLKDAQLTCQNSKLVVITFV